MSDEFKDAGNYFGEGEYVSLPAAIPSTDWTLEGWFIWLSGEGPLVEADDASWHLANDVGGRCGYRLGGADRTTDLAVKALRDSWIHLALAKEGSDVALYLNGTLADSWGDAPAEATLSACAVMRNAVGFAADIAVYERRLDDDAIGRHWEAGKDRV